MVVLCSVLDWIPSSHRTTVYLVGVQTEKFLVAHSDLYSGPDAKCVAHSFVCVCVMGVCVCVCVYGSVCMKV